MVREAKGDEEGTLVVIVVEAKVPRAFGTRRTRLAPHRHLDAPATGCEPVGVSEQLADRRLHLIPGTMNPGCESGALLARS